MPAAGSAAGIARKWEGERRVRPRMPTHTVAQLGASA